MRHVRHRDHGAAARWRVRLARGLVLLVLPLVFTIGGCRSRSTSGELTPPGDAPGWESRWRPFFDDDYTAEPINLRGRAPHDVRDQKLLAGRMGYANVVAQVRVLQVWGQGRYQGRQDQYLEIEIELMMMGTLVKGTSERQLVRVQSEDELPGALQGQSLILFVRWAPGDQPAYHHHLMPTDSEAMGYIAALLEHAKEEGVLDDDGVTTEKRRGRKGKKARQKKGKRGRKADRDDKRASSPARDGRGG